MFPITVLGSRGWIGSALVTYMKHQGMAVRAVDRHALPAWLAGGKPLGPVIYTIGLTADFRNRPHATVEAHVGLLSRILQRPGLNNLLYLSSTRVYSRTDSTCETTPLTCLSTDPSDIYNLSKLLGEALVLQDQRPTMRVVRLSNVIGPGQPVSTFAGALIAEARTKGCATIQQLPNTKKDYVSLGDVVRLLLKIALHGQHRLYNLGSGRNSSHKEVASWLQSQGIMVKFAAYPEPGLSFSPLDIERLREEFGPPSHPFKQPSL
jgi:nucleoside-diphosphate-sugar epimerase